MLDSLLGLIIFIFSIVLHEIGHAWVAVRLGDLTPKYDGRLTLNPVAHADIWGSVVIPILCALSHSPILGWAKPVEHQYIGEVYIGRVRMNGDLLVSLAGVTVNFLLAICAAVVGHIAGDGAVASLCNKIVWVNVILGVFNFWPIPPLDGWRIWGVWLPFHWQMFIEAQAMIFMVLLFWLSEYLPTYWVARGIYSFLVG
jgi:Zn-dependent protease